MFHDEDYTSMIDAETGNYCEWRIEKQRRDKGLLDEVSAIILVTGLFRTSRRLLKNDTTYIYIWVNACSRKWQSLLSNPIEWSG